MSMTGEAPGNLGLADSSYRGGESRAENPCTIMIGYIHRHQALAATKPRPRPTVTPRVINHYGSHARSGPMAIGDPGAERELGGFGRLGAIIVISR